MKPLTCSSYIIDVFPRNPQRLIVAPGERRIDDRPPAARLRALSRSSNDKSASLCPTLIAEQPVVPFQIAADRLGIRIEQQLVRIEPVPGCGSYGPCTRKP